MIHLRSFLLILALSCVNAACSKGTPSAQVTGTTPPPGLITSYNEMTQTPLTCAGDCPEAIGEILHYGSGPATSCTVTLINADTVVTASHCVEPKSHENRFCFVRFPRTAEHDAQIVKCATLVHASHFRRDTRFQVEKKFEKDYAIVKLDHPVDREPTPFNTDSLSSNLQLQVSVFGIESDANEHHLNSIHCVYQSSMTFDDQRYADPSNLLLKDCPIQMGYSGGPIFPVGNSQPIGLISLMKLQTSADESRIAIGTRLPSRSANQ